MPEAQTLFMVVQIVEEDNPAPCGPCISSESSEQLDEQEPGPSLHLKHSPYTPLAPGLLACGQIPMRLQ